MIKGVRPTGKYKSGTYTPINKDKYIGKYPIVYRSSWERKFCIYCDKSDTILRWSSESMQIQYVSPIDKSIHRYYPDFYFEIQTLNNGVVKYVAEVKPYGKTQMPRKPKRETKKAIQNYNYALKEHLTILSKARYAKVWCEKHGYKYVFLTERDWKNVFTK